MLSEERDSYEVSFFIEKAVVKDDGSLQITDMLVSDLEGKKVTIDWQCDNMKLSDDPKPLIVKNFNIADYRFGKAAEASVNINFNAGLGSEGGRNCSLVATSDLFASGWFTWGFWVEQPAS